MVLQHLLFSIANMNSPLVARRCCYHTYRFSQMFFPRKDLQHKDKMISNNLKLMEHAGIVNYRNLGRFALLPLGMRAVDKLCSLIDKEMTAIGAQKMLLPYLTHSSLWKTSGRIDLMGAELTRVKDRGEIEYLLSPTYEEAITDMLATSSFLSDKQLPLCLYQISTKFRDESRSRYGLIRSKEFLMKDLYSFDNSLSNAEDTYETVKRAYDNIFKAIGVPFVTVRGDSGVMGGKLSEEYHYISPIGEDEITYCEKCGKGICAGGIQVDSSEPANTLCDCNVGVKTCRSIEVGHVFLLGERYSKPLNAVFTSAQGNFPLVMGCYGLGITRILGSAIEVLSSEGSLRWPRVFAPFTVCIVTPKKNSKESAAEPFAWQLSDALQANVECLRGDVAIDDRDKQTIGNRVREAKKSGYPFIVVAGKTVLQDPPQYEVINTNTNETMYLSQSDAIDYIKNN